MNDDEYMESHLTSDSKLIVISNMKIGATYLTGEVMRSPEYFPGHYNNEKN